MVRYAARLLLLTALVCLAPLAARAQKAPALTHENVAYGPHERNVLDLWLAEADEPTPLVVFIHGGGFVQGDKSQIRNRAAVPACLERGVSFASINYRFRDTAPIQEILRDAARAIQFLRSRAGEWNLDGERIASFGGSAGAGTSLWLAFHDDLADPTNDDPVLRQSSRLFAAGSLAGQASYDLRDWDAIVGPAPTGAQRSEADWLAFYHFASADEMNSPAGQQIMRDCSMINLISADDPPVILVSVGSEGPSRDRGHYLHHPQHSRAIGARCEEKGVEAEVVVREEDPGGATGMLPIEFFLKRFGKAPR